MLVDPGLFCNLAFSFLSLILNQWTPEGVGGIHGFSSESETNYALVARQARHLSAIILANTDCRSIDFCVSVVTWLTKHLFFCAVNDIFTRKLFFSQVPAPNEEDIM